MGTTIQQIVTNKKKMDIYGRYSEFHRPVIDSKLVVFPA